MRSQHGAKRRRPGTGWIAAPAIAIIAALIFPTSPALATDGADAETPAAAPVAISEGHVDWGIKESWRNYIKGGDYSGGVKELEDGTYRWPIVSGAFDETKKHLTLELAGSIHYTAYCDDQGSCQLDSTFKDLSLEIGEDRQVITGTYVGRPREGDGAQIETRTGVLATLDLSGAEVGVADGTAQWSGLTSTAGEAMAIYAVGTPTDPVKIEYKGPGAIPDLAERWANQGAPQYAPSASWSATSGKPPGYFLSEAGDTLIVVETLTDDSDDTAEYQFTALDATTLAVIETTRFSEGEEAYEQAAFDAATGTVFFKTGAQQGPDFVVSLNTATWSAEKQEFVFERGIDAVSSGGVPDYHFQAGAFLHWHPSTSQVVWSRYSAGPGSDPLNGQLMRTVERDANGAWRAIEHTLRLPAEYAEQSRSTQEFFLGRARPDSHSPARAIPLDDGSFLAAFGGTLAGPNGTTLPTPLVRLAPEAGGGWSSSTVPDSIGPDFSGYGKSAYVNLVWAADGSILAGGNAWAGSLGYFTPRDNGTFDAAFADPAPGNNTLKVLGVGSDPGLGLDFAVDATSGAINVLKGRKPVANFELKMTNYDSRVLATADHGLVVLASESWTKHTIHRFDLQGVTPEVTKQPAASSVSLIQGALSGSASLGVEWSATGDTTVQWQRKLPTQKRFTDVPGATTAQFAPEVELEHDGAEFRAVLSNTAGKVVSDTAKVTVASAPRFLAQPTDLTIRDGDTARLTAPVAPGIAGEQRWEQLTGDTWTPVDTGGPFTVAGDTLTIIANPDLDGAQFRSVLANDVGENASDAAALTVLAKTVIPAEGQQYEGVTFEWDVSNEVQAKPPFGGANHLSAGVSDGSEASYQAEAGNVRIVHTTADGARTPASYATRAAFVGTGGKQLLTLTGGTATVKPDGSAVVTWQGAFSINMYGGLVPFTITNPTLTVTPDGTGTLTGDMSGYAGDMQNPTVKTPIDPVTGVTIATFTGVKLDTLNPFTVAPEYAGVRVDLPAEATPQLQTGEHWGSWPQGFVDFQVKTGLSSYWYSSGSSFDPKKAPNPFTIDFTKAEVVTPPVTPEPVTPAPETPAPEAPAPETPNPEVTDVADPGAGSKDTGSKDTGSKDTGSKNTAAKGTKDDGKKLAKTGAADALGLSAAAALLLLAGAAAVTVGSRVRKETARP